MKIRFFLWFACIVFVACSQHYDEGTHPPPIPPSLPAGHPPVAKPGGDETVVSGTIRLGDGLASKLSAQAVLFIIARPAPVGGPPLAVKRVSLPDFPYDYTLTRANAMMVQGLDWDEIDALYLTARIDADGSAGQVMAGDMEGTYTQNPVVPGAVGVDIVIDKVH